MSARRYPAPMVLPVADPSAPPTAAELAATRFVDKDHPLVRAYAEQATATARDDRERVRLLFAAVRDDIRYDPYNFTADPADYVASSVLERAAAYCIPKAVLLAASARALGIPARLGFSDVRNHLQSDRLREAMGTDVFVWHGFTELYVDGAWRKATPAFNTELCARFGVPALEFDGSADALLHPFSGDGAQYMEYVCDHGVFVDLPFEQLMEALHAAYPTFLAQVGGEDDPAFAASPAG